MDTIVGRIEHAAKGDRSITFVTGDQPVVKTWSQLHQEAKILAARLQRAGIVQGDRVALLGPTTPDLVTAFQAVWLCGATLVVLPLPMRMASFEEFTAATRQRVALADVAALIVDSDLVPFIEVTADDPPLYDLGQLLVDDGLTVQDFVRPDYDPEELCVLQFTSGSTSEPKGVMLPNHVMTSNLDAIYEAAEVDVDQDVMVSWLPLYHDMGLVGFCILPMTAGIDLVLAAPQDFLGSPGRWMEWISEYGGTATAGPNFSWVLATRALRRPDVQLDLSSLRVGLNGAEPVDPSSVRAFIEAGGRHGMDPGAVFPAFGMAEVAIAGSFPVPGTGLVTDTVDADRLETDHLAVPVGSDHPQAREIVLLGWPVPGLEFRIVSTETGQVADERMVGELQIRGTSVTPGYFRNDEANAKLFQDGWLRTGDLAYMVDGQMAMCGRIKDLIIVGGRNVYPQDIERAVGEVEGVRAGNVIAFGAPGRNGKEQIVVVAETRVSDELDDLRQQVSDTTRRAVGVPARQVVLVKPSTLPKTSSGKLQRALCSRRYTEGLLEVLD